MVLGVDLRASPKRPSTVVALNDHSSLSYVGSFLGDEELAQVAQALKPQLISIGAPLSLPLGLCCLEPSHTCILTVPRRKGRLLELELARMGISCFFTNKSSVIRNLIYRGIELRKLLQESDFEVIEVYPHATKVILFGDKVPPRKSTGSLFFLKERLPLLISCIGSYMAGMDRNACDAVLNAYTGFLHTRSETDVLGSDEEGTLVLPKLPR